MSNSDIVIKNGKLLDDPELRFTPSGTAVAKLTIMVSERKKDAATGEWGYGETSFVSCIAWQQMAEAVSEGLVKGDLVLATGKMEQRKYETKEGEKRSVWEVTLDDIGKSLRWSGSRAQKPKAEADSSDVPF